jgi:hypothetical protein
VGQSVADSQSNAGENQISPSAVSRTAPIQIELETLSDKAEDIYDLAKVNKRHKISKKLDKLKNTAKAIKLIRNEENDFFSQQLMAKIDELDQVISAKNKKDTMRFANTS